MGQEIIRHVEVPGPVHTQEVVRHVPKTHTVEKVVHVSRPQVQVVEKIVEERIQTHMHQLPATYSAPVETATYEAPTTTYAAPTTYGAPLGTTYGAPLGYY